MNTSETFTRFLQWLTIIFLLPTGLLAQLYSSPCPKVVQYLADRSIWLTVQPPSPPGSKVHLLLRLYTTSKEIVEDDEELVLVEDKSRLNERLLSGSTNPINYKVQFSSRVPAIVKDVILNSQLICSNENVDRKYLKYEVNLVHSFQPAGDPVLSPVRLELTDAECGRPSPGIPFIHHGEETLPGQWPWHAAIYWQEGAGLQYKCGGTLITLTAMITAAHCVTNSRGEAKEPRELTVYLGKHRLSLWGDEVQAKEVKAVNIYPLYNSSSYHYDIAILTFRSPAFVSLFVKPACVWGAEDENLLGILGKLGHVVGWGQNERQQYEDSLKLGRIEVVSIRECLTSNTRFTHFTTNRTFCAGFRNGTQNPCGGDSGGGLVFQQPRSEEWLLRGVVSVGSPRLVDGVYVCDPKQYTIFTDVSTYKDWILSLAT